MPLPQKFGEPCWDPSSIDRSVSNIALMGEKNVAQFLSTHSPIDNIKIEKPDDGLVINDISFFNILLDTINNHKKEEHLTVIYAPPGTGKSHLINWLKIRLDDEISSDNYIPILIKRRNGSLKDDTT